jgi:hypothetical protein
MKKSEAQANGSLILIGIVIYPFVWLHEKVGWGGMIGLGSLVLSGIVYGNIRAARRNSEEFNRLVLYALHNRLQSDEAKRMNFSLAKTDFPRSALIRRLQVLRDSIEIALASKKRDTAESRMAEVRSSYEEIRKDHVRLIAPETLAEIDRVVGECEKEFSTIFYANIAGAHIDKAGKLKTDKSKAKYSALAMEVIIEGLENPDSEKSRLKEVKRGVELFTQSLEGSS